MPKSAKEPSAPIVPPRSDSAIPGKNPELPFSGSSSTRAPATPAPASSTTRPDAPDLREVEEAPVDDEGCRSRAFGDRQLERSRRVARCRDRSPRPPALLELSRAHAIGEIALGTREAASRAVLEGPDLQRSVG